jgi:hypothetical protein
MLTALLSLPFLFSCRNVRFRSMIDQNLDRYDAAPKHLKMPIAFEILKDVQDLGGRFLAPCDLGWKEIDEVTAREKVSSCFRSFRKVKGSEKKKAPALAVHAPKRQSEFPEFSFSEKERRMF